MVLAANMVFYQIKVKDANQWVRGGWWLSGPTDAGGLNTGWQLTSLTRVKLLVEMQPSGNLESYASLNTE